MDASAAQRLASASWIEWSGLPLKLNTARAGAWGVLKKIIELDCAHNREPAAVEICAESLAECCGLTVEALNKLIPVLLKQKVLKAYWPDHPREEALLEIITPLATPRPAVEAARQLNEPAFRHLNSLRYATAAPVKPVAESDMQQVAEWYMQHLSQKMNSFVLEQIEAAVRRFPLDAIRRMIERAERHNLRNFGWVLKELYREESRTPRHEPKLGNKL